MSPESRWRLAARLESEAAAPITLTGASSLEFYTLGAWNAPTLEIAAPIPETSKALARLGAVATGTRWLVESKQAVQLSGEIPSRRRVQVGDARFHVQAPEEALVEAARRWTAARHPAARSALVILGAAQRDRLDWLRVHDLAHAAGCAETIHQLRRRLST